MAKLQSRVLATKKAIPNIYFVDKKMPSYGPVPGVTMDHIPEFKFIIED